MPPTDEPSQASELASEGAERAPPRSAAMDLRPTAVIHSAPNDSDRSATETEATTQEERDSMLDVVSTRPGGVYGADCSLHGAPAECGRPCNMAKPIPDFAFASSGLRRQPCLKLRKERVVAREHVAEIG